MLCELHALGDHPLLTWALLSLLGVLAVAIMSGSVFLAYYVSATGGVTYEQWVRKLNPAYPPADAVRAEVLQTLKGLVTATICPTVSLALAQRGLSHAYCGLPAGHTLAEQAAAFLFIWVACDFYEFFYHWLGHSFSFLWAQHRPHHVFYNPSPFAVIADDVLDQFVRSAPLLLLPLIAPVNIDLLFGTFVLFFYFYGTFLHWGFESAYLSAHQPFVNGAYEHYFHHSKATGPLATGPIFCGFMFKCWDQLAGSVPPAGKPCLCSRCEAAAGRRSPAAFAKLEKPDYSPLLRAGFWLEGVRLMAGLEAADAAPAASIVGAGGIRVVTA